MARTTACEQQQHVFGDKKHLIRRCPLPCWFYLIVYCIFILALSEGAVTGPKSTSSPIRLSKPKAQEDVNRIFQEEASTSTSTSTLSSTLTSDGKLDDNVNRVTQYPQSRSKDHHPNTGTHHQTTGTEQRTNNPVKQSPSTRAKLEIVEPPDESYIAGSNVYVKVKVLAEDPETFHRHCIEEGHGRVCFSLDSGPFHCWPLDNVLSIFYSQAVEGSHTLVAKLYKEGKIQDDSISSTITFTTVDDPTIEMHPNATYHTQMVKPNITANVTQESNVNITFPVVQIMSPANRVSYTGEDLTFHSLLEPIDKESFEQYFKHAFICFNVDMATAHSCFPIFGGEVEKDPLVLGLDPGMHTIDAAISHPESGDLLEGSSLGTQVFFMTGKFNEGAALTAKINIRGKAHTVPVAKGGDITAQSKALCYTVGLSSSNTCMQSVSSHLTIVAEQSGLALT